MYYTNPRKGDILHSSLDNSKLKKEHGWEPETSVKDGVLETYHWYKEYMSNHC